MKKLTSFLTVSTGMLALGCSTAFASTTQCPQQLTVQGITASASQFETSQAELQAIKLAQDAGSNPLFHFVYIDDGGIAHCAYTSDKGYIGLIDVNLKAQYAMAKPHHTATSNSLLSVSTGSWQGIRCGSTDTNQCSFDIQG